MDKDEIKRAADRAERRPDKKVVTGRPTTYTDSIADAICERLTEGESLRSVCRDATMPAQSTVFRWLTLNKGFSEQYALAKQSQAELLADQIVGIADGTERVEDLEPDVNRDRLRVDARKWVAARLLPKKYGDKVQQEVSGKDGAPLTVVFQSNDQKVL